MRKLILVFVIAVSALSAYAQMDLPASGNNTRATITEEVGITNISIKYSRPDVNKREGKIWGDLIPYGFASQNLVTNKNDMPWRAGANENTIISFEHDVKVEGKNIKAGSYGLFMAVWPDSVIIIFSNQTGAWGSFYYDEKNDVVRVKVKPVPLDKSVEYLKYEFIEQKEKYCVIALQWEKLSIPFKVDVDVENIVIAKLREDVTGQKGFNQLNLVAAANYCLNKNINLEEALAWAQRAAGLKSFGTLNTLSTAYTKNNKLAQADSAMNEALVFASPNQYMGAGRAMITAKRLDRAFDIFNMNQKKNGNVYAVNAGFMSYYSATANFEKAMAFAKLAMDQAPNENTKKQIEGNLLKLKDGKDINQQ